MALSLGDRTFLDDTFSALYQPLTVDTYPAEGEEASPGRLSRLYSGLRWTQVAGTPGSRCRASGKTGLMAGVYKARLPRVRADLRHGTWVHM